MSRNISSSNLFGCSHTASQNALVLRRDRSSFVRQSSRSHSANISSRWRNSASHSRRQLARRLRGTITPTARISQRYGFLQSSNIEAFYFFSRGATIELSPAFQSRVSGSIFDPVAAATVVPDQKSQPSLRRLEGGATSSSRL